MENILEHARAVLSTTPARWQSLAQSWPAFLLTRRPAADDWSAVECLLHLIDADPVYRARVGHFLAGKDFVDHSPAHISHPPDEPFAAQDLAAIYAQQRAESLIALEMINPVDLTRQVRHSALGLVTLEEMVHQWAAHDLQHTQQAERAVMQPFIHGSGPWRVYYADLLMPEAMP
jgi:hypothetical protein